MILLGAWDDSDRPTVQVGIEFPGIRHRVPVTFLIDTGAMDTHIMPGDFAMLCDLTEEEVSRAAHPWPNGYVIKECRRYAIDADLFLHGKPSAAHIPEARLLVPFYDFKDDEERERFEGFPSVLGWRTFRDRFKLACAHPAFSGERNSLSNDGLVALASSMVTF